MEVDEPVSKNSLDAPDSGDRVEGQTESFGLDDEALVCSHLSAHTRTHAPLARTYTYICVGHAHMHDHQHSNRRIS